MELEFTTPEDAKDSTSLKIIYTINVIIISINIEFDYYLVKVTLKNRSLHKPCLILIGVYFLCQLLWSTSVFVPFVILILPSTILESITMRTCSFVNLVPLTAYYAISTVAFTIAFDRLLSVYFPLWYAMRLSIKWHILFLTILSGAIPLYVSICIIQNGMKYGSLKTLCTMAEMLRDQLQYQAPFSFYTNIGAIICYLAIFSKFVWRKFFNNSQQNNSSISTVDLQVLKAVALILSLQIFMWIIGTLSYQTFMSDSTALDHIDSFKLAIILSCISFTMYTLDVPIIYFTSSLHRAALQNELKWMKKIFGKKNQVQNLVIVIPASQTIGQLHSDKL